MGEMHAPSVALEKALAEAVQNGIRRYIAERRRRVPEFVDRHFSLRGSLAMHRAALGMDLLRAPANLLLVGPHAGMKAVGLLAEKLGNQRIARAIERRNLLLRTDLSRRIDALLLTELFELPADSTASVASRDVLIQAILDDPALANVPSRSLPANAQSPDESQFRACLAEAMATYGSTRAAAAGIVTSLLILCCGALILKQLTPGAVTLGPALAAMFARNAAISAFPLGAGAGRIWYSLFHVAPSPLLVAGLTGGLIVAVSLVAAFAGLLTDPIQRRLGLHARRLNRMLDAIERQLLDPAAPGFTVHDHFVARLLDLFDLLGTAWRLALR